MATRTAPYDFIQLDEELGHYNSRRARGVSTHLLRQEDGSIALRYHNTHVLTFHPDGRVIAHAGGWRSATTKERINRQAVAAVYSRNFEWFASPIVDGQISTEREVPFEDGMDLSAL